MESSASDLQALKEWALSTFVQKDTCTDKHEKLNGDITEIKVTQGKIGTKLSVIQWIGVSIAGTSIATLCAALYNLILK